MGVAILERSYVAMTNLKGIKYRINFGCAKKLFVVCCCRYSFYLWNDVFIAIM